MRWFRLLAALLLPTLSPLAASGAGGTSARLLLPVESVKPGESFFAGIRLTMKPGWHTYWRNGGDAGAPTTIEWTLPTGVTAGEIRWPAPERLEEDGLVTYVYHGAATLLVPISVAANVPPGPLELKARLKWLECEKSCIPGGATVEGRLTAGTVTHPSGDAAALQAAEAALPAALPAEQARAIWDGPASGDERPVVIRWRIEPGGETPDFLPDASTAFEVQPATERLPQADGYVSLRKKVKKLEGDWPKQLRGVLVLLNAKKVPTRAFEANLAVEASVAARSETPAPPAPATPAGASRGAAPAEAPAAAFSLARALLFGLIGGMILNIMPCVLPVIALKILGFVRQSGNRPAEIRKLGLIYAAGVWFSFLVLAGAVIAVQRATGGASWGMQFGNPIFLVAMTTLVLMVSLSLFGVYEITISGRAMDAAGDLASREGPSGAFFNGMLAVALATPCTAPFLAPALGYAFTAPNPATIVLVFSAVAVGLAAPYVILSWQPAWLKHLPKPGAWMEHFKVAMGFPMLATALWLYTLAADRFGAAGPLWLGLFLIGLALATWVWGQFVQRGRRRQSAGAVIALGLAAISYAWPLERELDWRHARPEAAATGPVTAGAGEIAWQNWSPEALVAARQTGRPVLVDFTAEWCLTCKLNERSSLAIEPVREKLRALNAVTLKGDYTRTPPAITAELKRFGRAGVPLVLVYPRDAAGEPIVLPEVLTPGLVLDALDRAAR